MIEKVNPCHPDKVADRIAGAIVDLAYEKEESESCNPSNCGRYENRYCDCTAGCTPCH